MVLSLCRVMVGIMGDLGKQVLGPRAGGKHGLWREVDLGLGKEGLFILSLDDGGANGASDEASDEEGCKG
jgi:hypothetical protein